MIKYSLIPLCYEFDFVGDFHENLAYVRKNIQNFQVGYINKTGNIVIPLDYFGRYETKRETLFVHFPFFRDGRAALINGSGKFGYLDSNGNICVPFEYDSTCSFAESFAAVKKGLKWGFVDRDGNVVISFIFDHAYGFNSGLAIVEKGGKYGFVNSKGEIIIDFQFDIQAHQRNTGFNGEYATVVKNNEVGVIDKKGDMVIPLSSKYDFIGSFQMEKAVVIKSIKENKQPYFGVINIAGDIVIPEIYNYIKRFGEGFIATETSGEKILIRFDEKRNSFMDFDEIADLREGLAFVKKNNKYGYIDSFGKTVIQPDYDAAASFSEGYAMVKKKDKWGFLNKNGEVVIPFIFDDATSFSEGMSIVTINGVKNLLCI